MADNQGWNITQQLVSLAWFRVVRKGGDRVEMEGRGDAAVFVSGSGNANDGRWECLWREGSTITAVVGRSTS